MKIDGLLILELGEEDLETELKITKKLHRRKILKAISILQEYNDFLSSGKKEIEDEEQDYVEQLTTANEMERSFNS